MQPISSLTKYQNNNKIKTEYSQLNKKGDKIKSNEQFY